MLPCFPGWLAVLAIPDDVAEQHFDSKLDNTDMGRLATASKRTNNRYYNVLRKRVVDVLLRSSLVLQSEEMLEECKAEDARDSCEVVRATRSDEDGDVSIAFTNHIVVVKEPNREFAAGHLSSCLFVVKAAQFEVFHTTTKMAQTVPYGLPEEKQQDFYTALEKDPDKKCYTADAYYISPTDLSAVPVLHDPMAFHELAFLKLGEAKVTFNPRRPASMMGGTVVPLATKKSVCGHFIVTSTKAVTNQTFYVTVTAPSVFGTVVIDAWIANVCCPSKLASAAMKECCGLLYGPRNMSFIPWWSSSQESVESDPILTITNTKKCYAKKVTVTLPKKRTPFETVGNTSVWRFGQ